MSKIIMMQKLKYLLRSLRDFRQQKSCPYCQSKNLSVIDSKYFVTSLLSCQNCFLSHRHPKDDPEFIKRFYQSDYSIDVAMMTTLPSDEELQSMMSENFEGIRNYSPYIEAVLGERRGAVVDYGCSWGYTVFQLKNHGFDATGLELSAPRAEFGRSKLNLDIKTKDEDIRMDNDVVISSHVIEHLLDVGSFVELCRSRLKDTGYFIAFCPNGSKEYQDREPSIFHVNWGFVHPNYLTCKFGEFVFRHNPYIILTGDWEFDLEDVRNWDGKSQFVSEKRDGKELLIIAKPNVSI